MRSAKCQTRASGQVDGVVWLEEHSRALAVTTAARQRILADVPAMAELLPGYEASGWYGAVAPKGTPTEIAEKLNKETSPNPDL